MQCWHHALISLVLSALNRTLTLQQNEAPASHNRANALAELQQEIRDLQNAKASMESDKQELIKEKVIYLLLCFRRKFCFCLK